MLMPSEKISGEVCPESEFSALNSSEKLALYRSHRRRWLTGLMAASVCASIGDILNPSSALAGAARPVSLPDLVHRSKHVLVATPRVADSMWEQIGGSRRLVTYTRLTIDEVMDDRELNHTEVLVRTLGGRLGALGQIVHGEAEMRRDETAVVFLRPHQDGFFHVTGLAQGHYPLLRDTQGVRRLTSSPRLSSFVGKTADSATAQLSGQSLLTARSLVQGVLSAR